MEYWPEMGKYPYQVEGASKVFEENLARNLHFLNVLY